MTVVNGNHGAPTSLRRAIVRCATVAGPSAGAWLAFSLSSNAHAQGPLDITSDAVENVSDSAAQLVSGGAEPIGQITAPVAQAVAPVVDNVSDAAAPVVDDVVTPVVSEVADTAEPFVDDVAGSAALVGKDVADYVAPVIDEVAQDTAPVVDIAAPVVAPVTGLITPVLDRTAPVTVPVAGNVAPAVTPVFGAITGVTNPGEAVLPASLAALLAPTLGTLDPTELAAAPVASDRSGGGIPAAGAPSTASFRSTGATWIPLSQVALIATTVTSSPAPATADAVLRPAPAGSSNPAGTPAAPSVPVPAGAPGCAGGTATSVGSNGSGRAADLGLAGRNALRTFTGTANCDSVARLPTRAFERPTPTPWSTPLSPSTSRSSTEVRLP